MRSTGLIQGVLRETLHNQKLTIPGSAFGKVGKDLSAAAMLLQLNIGSPAKNRAFYRSVINRALLY